MRFCFPLKAGILFFFSCTCIYAQDKDPLSYNGLKSPQPGVYEMPKFGILSPDLHTGRMQMSVPLYMYEDKDFSIPITLNYSYDGFKPSLGSGYVGLGWTLECGGTITREIIGLPDEFRSGEVYGFWHLAHSSNPSYTALKHNLADSTFTYVDTTYFSPYQCPLYYSHTTPYLSELLAQKSFFGNMVLLSPFPLLPMSDGWANLGELFDHSSDIYSYNFMGHTGKFIILPDGEVQVFDSSDPYGEITVSINMSSGVFGYSSITIHTGDGYKYNFGSDNSADYNDYSYDSRYDEDPAKNCFSTLRMRSIEAPNGRTVSFCTRKSENATPQRFLSTGYRSAFRKIQALDTIPASEHYLYRDKQDALVSFTISTVLDHVEIDGCKIATFNYSSRSNDEYGESSFTSEFINHRRDAISFSHEFSSSIRLSSVSIRNCDERRIDSIVLAQTYSSSVFSHSQKMFLKSVSGRNGRYDFQYLHASESDLYPSVDCEETDHWGYWRGSYGTFPFSTKQHIHSQDSSLYNLINNHKDPVQEYARYGAMTSVSYPTGGHSAIHYEQNAVHKRIDVNLLDPNGDFFIDSCGIYPAGGMRVKKIVNDSADGSMTDSLVFDYGTSGTLHSMPRYVTQLDAKDEFTTSTIIRTDTTYCYLVSWSNAGISLSKGAPVSYSDVNVGYSDSSYVNYKFYDTGQYMDRSLINSHDGYLSKLFLTVSPDPDNSHSTLHRLFPFNQSRYHRYAAVSDVVTSDMSCIRGKLKSKEVFHSDSTTANKTEYHYSARKLLQNRNPFNCFSHYALTNVYHYHPQLDSITETVSLDNGVAVSMTTYEYNDRGQLVKERNRSFDGIVETTYYNYNSPMIASGARSTIADKAMEKTIDGTAHITSLTHFDYNPNVFNAWLPVTKKQYIIDVPYQTSTPLIPQLDTASVVAYEYNGNGRLSGIHLPGCSYLKLEWDPYGRHLMSCEENGSVFRNSFKWIDMVGLIEKTDGYSVKEYYLYDSKGRLSSVLNADYDAISSFRYSLVTDDAAADNHIENVTRFNETDSCADIKYFNGLGFHVQTVSLGGGDSSDRHICVPIEYDALRRDDAKIHLPFPTDDSGFDGNALEHQKAYYRSIFGDDETRPFAETGYESSPGGRRRWSQKPGAGYEQSGKRVLFGYLLNTAQDSVLDIRYGYDTEPFLNISSQYVCDGSLICSSTVDENGLATMTFSNSRGNVVLSRQESNSIRQDTYYVYDLKDSLVCVVQPEGAARLLRNSILRFHSANQVISEYSFLYEYDGLGNVIKKKKPGCGWETYIFDERCRPVLMTDGNLATDNKWIRNSYDKFDDIKKVSIVSAHYPEDSLRCWAWKTSDTVTVHHVIEIVRDTVRMREFDYELRGQDIYYPADSTVAVGGMTYLEDGSECCEIEGMGIDEEMGWYIELEGSRYFPVGNYIDIVFEKETEHDLPDWNTQFDSKLNHIVSTSDYSYDRVGYSPAGVQPPVPSYLAFSHSSGSLPLCGTSLNRKYYEKLLVIPPSGLYSDSLFIERAYYFDRMGRVLQCVERSGEDSHILRTDYRYDLQGNILTAEESVSMGGATVVKKTQNTYDNRGRLIRETVTMDSQSTPLSETEISYDCLGRKCATVFCGIRDSVSYNLQGWLSTMSSSDTEGCVLFSQSMTYDYRGDIIGMEWKNGTSNWKTCNYGYDGFGRLASSLVDGSNAWTERNISYDRNGNMLSLARYSESTTSPQQNYSFTNNGNKLLKINGGNSFIYDGNGNVSYDSRIGRNIRHNYLNLPASVRNAQGSEIVGYRYCSDGLKTSMTHSSGIGRAYIGDMIFSKSSTGVYTFESTNCLSGRIVADGSSYSVQRFIRDHLGSTRAVYLNGDVLERNDYYPFGGRMNCTGPASTSNRFRFSGKEIQTEGGSGWLDFGARIYDSDICRWLEVDPLAANSVPFSPFVYCNNNPNNNIDPNGMDIWSLDSEGRLIKRDSCDDDIFEMNGLSICLPRGTVISHHSYSFKPENTPVDYLDVFKIRGDDSGTVLFEFLGEQLSEEKIEVSLARCGFLGKKGLNFIAMSHQKPISRDDGKMIAFEYAMPYLFEIQLCNGYTIREMIHSHPFLPNASTNDIKFAGWIDKRVNPQHPVYKIWHSVTKTYFRFFP